MLDGNDECDDNDDEEDEGNISDDDGEDDDSLRFISYSCFDFTVIQSRPT